MAQSSSNPYQRTRFELDLRRTDAPTDIQPSLVVEKTGKEKPAPFENRLSPKRSRKMFKRTLLARYATRQVKLLNLTSFAGSYSRGSAPAHRGRSARPGRPGKAPGIPPGFSSIRQSVMRRIRKISAASRMVIILRSPCLFLPSASRLN